MFFTPPVLSLAYEIKTSTVLVDYKKWKQKKKNQMTELDCFTQSLLRLIEISFAEAL